MTDTIGQVYEVVLQTDEAYYTTAFFYDKDEADRVVAQGNAALEGGPDRYIHFESRPRPVIANTGDWSADDFKAAMSDNLGEYGEDYFRREPDDD